MLSNGPPVVLNTLSRNLLALQQRVLLLRLQENDIHYGDGACAVQPETVLFCRVEQTTHWAAARDVAIRVHSRIKLNLH